MSQELTDALEAMIVERRQYQERIAALEAWARSVCTFLTDVQNDERCYHIARSQAGYWRDRYPVQPTTEQPE